MIDLSGKTMGELLSSMLLRITEEVNKREGSLIRTALSAAAWAIEGLYVELINVQQQAYGTTATGQYLDYKAEERGVVRNPATQAVYEMYANLNTLPLNFQLADSSGYTWNVTSSVISGPDASDNYKYYITCQTAGAIPEPSGNLRSLSFYAGLTTAFFGNAVTPGTDVENDASLRQRYLESLVEIAFAGNIAAYREKILELVYPVSGGSATVGALQVYPTTDSDGSEKAGHVKIYVIGPDYEIASSALVNAVQDAICPMYNGVVTSDGYGWAPIGACVHIVSATIHPVLRIEIQVTLSSGVTVESVETKIKENVMAYVDSMKHQWGTQVSSRTASAKIYIREAFIYAAALITGVVDVPSVVLKKDGVVQGNSAVWTTTSASMEWIVDSEVEIAITA